MPISRRDFLKGAAAAGSLATLGSRHALAALGAAKNAPVDTIVVVMMENRSFDHYLGWLEQAVGQQEGLAYLDHEGVPHETRRWAPDYSGCAFEDPDHSWEGGRIQLDPDHRDASGFRRGNDDDFALGYYTATDVPVWAALTKQATVFDNYFVSILGPTFPNREYMHAATSGGRKSNVFPNDPENGFGDTTIWDRCDQAGVSWAYYYSNLPVIGLYGGRLLRRPEVRHVSAYFTDAQLGWLPNVAFVDPFFTLPGERGNDDHPHADIRRGQEFLSQVIRAFTTSPQWRRGALFVNYDEWGGFFDTQVPASVPDDRHHPTDLASDFGQRGFRCPAAVVSPFARRGELGSQLTANTYDHTSILKFIEWRFGMPPLTVRDKNAQNIGEVLNLAKPDFSEPEIRAYTAPPEALGPCGDHAAPASDAQQLALLAEPHGIRTDYKLADSLAEVRQRRFW
jgi:phospholipase C